MKTYWNPSYVAEGFDTTAKSAWIIESLAERPIPSITITDPEIDAAEVIRIAKTVHDPAYVDKVVAGEIVAVPGAVEDEPELVRSVLASSGGMVAAARAVANGEQRRAFSLSAGMHHASYNRSAGFCTLNGLAMAARVLADEGIEDILILDLDAHHGGGTEDILNTHLPHVAHLDIAVDGYDDWRPRRDRTYSETVRGSYLDAVRRGLEWAVALHPQQILYNAGMDPHEDCEVGGKRGITSEILREREALVRDFADYTGAALVGGLAGGYIGRRLTIPTLVELHRSTLEELSR